MSTVFKGTVELPGKLFIPVYQTDLSTADTPTEAELDSAFGATLNASDEKAFLALIDENSASTNYILVVGSGGKWAFANLTVAS